MSLRKIIQRTRRFFVSLVLTSFVLSQVVFAQSDDNTPLMVAKADESRFFEAESLYISMIFDTIDTAHMSSPIRVDSAEIQRRQEFLLATPSVAPPDTIASLLVGKLFYVDNAMARFHVDQRYFDLLAECLCLAYANARDEYRAIEAPSAEAMGIWPIPAPKGYMAGIDPEAVVEEDLRADYIERLNAFKSMQNLRNAKQQAGVRLQRVIKSFRTIAEQIKSADDDRVTKRFLEILTKHAGEESIQELLPAKFEDRE